MKRRLVVLSFVALFSAAAMATGPALDPATRICEAWSRRQLPASLTFERTASKIEGTHVEITYSDQSHDTVVKSCDFNYDSSTGRFLLVGEHMKAAYACQRFVETVRNMMQISGVEEGKRNLAKLSECKSILENVLTAQAAQNLFLATFPDYPIKPTDTSLR